LIIHHENLPNIEEDGPLPLEKMFSTNEKTTNYMNIDKHAALQID
jgi:hypothetical protein